MAQAGGASPCRVRLDLACMLYQRTFGQRPEGSPRVFRQFMLDASPKLGLEFACSAGQRACVPRPVGPPEVRDHSYGCVAMAHRRTSAADKGAALAFALWREHGPTAPRLRALAESVRGAATDRGAERNVCLARSFVGA
eukprot:5699882-Alexandrium_andersonii.AAC.1